MQVYIKETGNKSCEMKIKSENDEENESYIQKHKNIKKEIKKVENR